MRKSPKSRNVRQIKDFIKTKLNCLKKQNCFEHIYKRDFYQYPFPCLHGAKLSGSLTFVLCKHSI